MLAINEILKAFVDLGVQAGLVVVLVWYIMKRNKEREDSIVEEKIRLREEFKKQSEDVKRELDSYKNVARERESLLMSENSKREELIKKESEKREEVLKEEASKREAALMTQFDKMNNTMEKISTSMDGINKSMESITKRLETVESKIA